MNPNTEESPVYYTTPDGVERLVRYHLGAEKRVAELFKMPLAQAIAQYDKAAYPGILWCLMHGPRGIPPVGLDRVDFEESAGAEEVPKMMAAILSAFSKGRMEKNEIEVLIKAGLQKQIDQLTGSRFGRSVVSASISPKTTSGGSVAESSLPSASATVNDSPLTTTAQG